MAKVCPKCKAIHLKPEKYFHKNKSTKDGFTTYCKQCTNEMNSFSKEKKKPPKDKRVCDNQECNNTFETRNKEKRFCCPTCANKENNKKTSKDRDYRFKYEFGNKFKNEKLKSKNTFKRWTKKDDAKLLNLRFNGLDFWEIAKQMDRSYFAVGQRHRMLVKKLNLNIQKQKGK